MLKRNFSEEHRKKLSESHRGQKPWNFGKKMPLKTRMKVSRSKKGQKYPPRTQEHRKKISENKRGAKNHFWRGGKTSETVRLRASAEYKYWRKAVFERDNFTCIWCGKRGGELNADHIKPWSLYPELRFAIDNGRTLCVRCHRTTDTFGFKLLVYKDS